MPSQAISDCQGVLSRSMALRAVTILDASSESDLFVLARGEQALVEALQIDARLIAQFAATVKPLARPAADANAQAIKDLVVRRRQLTSLRTMEKNRRQVRPSVLQPVEP